MMKTNVILKRIITLTLFRVKTPNLVCGRWCYGRVWLPVPCMGLSQDISSWHPACHPAPGEGWNCRWTCW